MTDTAAVWRRCVYMLSLCIDDSVNSITVTDSLTERLISSVCFWPSPALSPAPLLSGEVSGQTPSADVVLSGFLWLKTEETHLISDIHKLYHSSCFFLLSFSPFIILLLCSSSFSVWCSVDVSLQNKYKKVLISVRDSMKTSRKVNKIKDFIILT